MISIDCSMCGDELHEPGALVFSPPGKDDLTTKFHLCKTCWPKLGLKEKTREKVLMALMSGHPVARCFDDENMKEYTTAYFDGYQFGDRLLEGVIFKAELLDGYLEVSFHNKSDRFDTIARRNVLKEALEFAKRNDVFMSTPTGGGPDLCYVDPFDPIPTNPPKKIGKAKPKKP